MSIVENIQLVEVNDLGLSGDDFDDLLTFFEGEKYDRYYPSNSWNYIDAELKSKINKALLDGGAVFPEDIEHFYILFRID